MQKTIFSDNQRIFLELLRQARLNAGISQYELADRLAMTQSWISKVERGERGIDVLELRQWCVALDVSLLDFISLLEGSLTKDV